VFLKFTGLLPPTTISEHNTFYSIQNSFVPIPLKILNTQNIVEPLMRIELTTSSLPRKCSTPELQRLVEASHLRPSGYFRQVSAALPGTFARSLPPFRVPSPGFRHPSGLSPDRHSDTPPAGAKKAQTLARTGTLNSLSGRRGSNPRPTAWKAVALPTELLPHFPL
jgi:hypothetical protein